MNCIEGRFSGTQFNLSAFFQLPLVTFDTNLVELGPKLLNTISESASRKPDTSCMVKILVIYVIVLLESGFCTKTHATASRN